jgi:adenylosuccinate synthase
MNVSTPVRLSSNSSTAVVGLQWGDEGKGKLVDALAAEHDAVVRYNGGANAGHSIVVKGERYALHLIPSGILYPGKVAVIGNGVVVDLQKLREEMAGLEARGVSTQGLVLSSRSHLVLPYHKAEDGLREDLLESHRAEHPDDGTVSEIGTTRRGIGPAYSDKVHRASAVRVGDLLRPAVLKEKLELALRLKRPMLERFGAPREALDLDVILSACRDASEHLADRICDTTELLHGILEKGGRVLFEGANGTLLDVDHGTYPYVTSSNCGTAGIGSGSGVPLTRVGRIVGVMKAYSTRVGTGPLPTELKDATGDRIRTRGREFGTTTGRPRRVGWLDLVAVKYSVKINGVSEVAMTLLDVLAGFETIRICTAYRTRRGETSHFLPDAGDLGAAEPVYREFGGFAEEIGGVGAKEDLPDAARRYIDFIQDYLQVPLSQVGVGPAREQTIPLA